ncbi:MAG: hypothetical protein RL885_23020 [Planctomycetota bacterium]
MALFSREKSRSSRSGRGAEESDPARRGILYLIAGGVTLVAGTVLVLHAMYRQIQKRPDFHVDPLAVELVAAPEWLPDPLARDLQYGHGLPAQPISVFASGLEQIVAERYAKHPWVETVHAVHVVYPGQVEVELELRRPAAFVQSGDGRALPIDRHGIRLPDLPNDDHRLRHLWLPLLLGVLRPAPPVGEPWNDRAIHEGVALVEALREPYQKYLSRSLRFGAIDVSNVGGRVNPLDSELAFVSAEQVLVEWGRSPASPNPDPMRLEEKLRNLRSALVEYPGLVGLSRVKLDEPHGPVVVPASTARIR